MNTLTEYEQVKQDLKDISNDLNIKRVITADTYIRMPSDEELEYIANNESVAFTSEREDFTKELNFN